MRGKYIVAIAPPTPNGDLHLGHISGPFLAGDIFARIRRQCKDEVVFVSYSDECQDYVERKAIQLHQRKQDVFGTYSTRIAETLKKIDVELDCFMFSHDNIHFKNAVKMFYENAVKANLIGKKWNDVPFISEGDIYGYEAFAKGKCNYCGTDSDPSQCEHCAKSPIVDEMGDLTCILNDKVFSTTKVEREYLKLNSTTNLLAEIYQNRPLRNYLKEYIDEVLADGKLDWFIDRPNSNGIDIEVDGETKIISTWFSGIAGYYAATQEVAHQRADTTLVDSFWKDKNTQIYYFLGFDCSFSHGIVYPSLLGVSNDFTKNVTPITNKFLKLEGGDFSTSRGHAIWVNDILESYDVDGVRFYLAINSPENEVTNFEMESFDKWYTQIYVPFFQKLNELSLVSKENDFIGVYDEVINVVVRWNKYSHPDHFSIAETAKVCQDLMEILNNKMDEKDLYLNTWISLFVVTSKSILVNSTSQLIAKHAIDENEVLDFFTSEKVKSELSYC